MLRQESDDPVDVKLVQRIVAHQQRVGALTQHGGEGVIGVGGAAHLDADQRHGRGRRRMLHLGQRGHGGGIVRIGEVGHARHARDRLAQDLQPLAAEVRAKNGIAGDVAARPGQARYQAGAHRIAYANHHDRDGRG